jgi:hypothetical protein
MSGIPRAAVGFAIVNCLVFLTTPAWAGGGEAGIGNANPSASGSTIGVRGSTRSSSAAPAPGSSPGPTQLASATSPPRCTYYAVSAQQAAAAGIPSHAGQGYWASVFCTTGPVPGTEATHTFALSSSGTAYKAGGFSYTWMPSGRAGPPSGRLVPLPSPLEVARVAEARAKLPAPGPLHFNPDEINGVGPLTIVNYSTWLWINRGMWHPVSVSAEVAPVRAAVMARPTSVTWDMGDGHTVMCDGPGLPWSPGEVSTSCKYSYRHSARQLTVKATVLWSITWSSNLGQSGTFPALRTSSSTPLSVTQVETVNTPG